MAAPQSFTPRPVRPSRPKRRFTVAEANSALPLVRRIVGDIVKTHGMILRLQAEMETMVWSHPSIRSSWYRNDAGKIYILSPWRLVDYWTWTRNADPEDYTFG